MRHNGWYDKPGVRILEGRWQDFLEPLPKDAYQRKMYLKGKSILKHLNRVHNKQPSDSEKLISPESEAAIAAAAAEERIDLGKFDIVYFDTFQEGYPGHFAFIRHVPRLLRGPQSRFSYFNGHCAMDPTKYQV
jgi:protein arginine N-methyltransferase 2